jgi:hypothetical protein
MGRILQLLESAEHEGAKLERQEKPQDTGNHRRAGMRGTAPDRESTPSGLFTAKLWG